MASPGGSPGAPAGPHWRYVMARHDPLCGQEFAADNHRGPHGHNHLNSRVSGFLDLSYFSACGVWPTKKYGWHQDDHYRVSTSQIIQHSSTARLLDANSAVTGDGPLTADFPSAPFRAWLVSYCPAVANRKAEYIAPRQNRIMGQVMRHGLNPR